MSYNLQHNEFNGLHGFQTKIRYKKYNSVFWTQPVDGTSSLIQEYV